MSVQSGLLAVLMMGPAYGSQLQAELVARAPHRVRLNAGQVYATLERLVRKGLVDSAGATDDGLPLYELTAEGMTIASEWLSWAELSPRLDWDEMLDQVLLAASLDDANADQIIDGYHAAWLTRLAMTRENDSAAAAAADRADDLIAEAALGWLEGMRSRLAASPLSLRLARAADRPRRGRPAR